MNHYDSRLPFSPLTDVTLAQVALQAWLNAGASPASTDLTFIDLSDALKQRMAGQPWVPHVPGVFHIDVGRRTFHAEQVSA